MKCPLCHTPMAAPPKAGAVAFVVSLVFGNTSKTAPDFQCPKCRTEVKAPPAVLMLHLETLEDYRRNCAALVSATGGGKQLMGGFWSEERQNQLDQHERFMRILDAMTPEERESSELPGPTERARILAASGTTPADLEQLFEEFSRSRMITEQARQTPVSVKKILLQSIVPVLVLAFPLFGAPLLAQSTVGAAVLSGLGYYLVSLLLVFLCLTRVKNARRLVFSSRLRSALFAVVLPALLAGAAFLLVHDHVVRAGGEAIPAALGGVAVGLFFFAAYIQISAALMMRRFRRARPDAQPAGPVPGEASRGP